LVALRRARLFSSNERPAGAIMSAMSSKRGVLVPVVLLGASLALVFVVGRGIEKRLDAAWQDVAERLHGAFQGGRACSELDRFGTPTPWEQWANDGELRCLRVIEGSDGGVPWALVQVRYSVRQRRGEEQPDAWYEVTVAALRRSASTTPPALVSARAPDGHVAMQNGLSLFVWKKGTPGAGASLKPGELPMLLEEARRLAAR
jgi:hypothetical protein